MHRPKIPPFGLEAIAPAADRQRQETGPLPSPAMIGATIRRLRRRQGLSQAELASQAGIRVATLSAIENGAEGTRMDTFLNIIQTLGYDVRLTPVE